MTKAYRHLKKYGLASFCRIIRDKLKNKIFNLTNKEKLSLRFSEKSIFNNLVGKFSPEFQSSDIYILTDDNLNINFQFGKRISNLNSLSDKDISCSVFYVYFQCDSDALPHLKRIVNSGGKFIPHLLYNKTPYRFINRLALNALEKTSNKENRISHFTFQVHENICEALDITRDLKGDYVEIGVYKGGSALTALNYIDQQREKNVLDHSRTCYFIDTFDGFNYEESEQSSDIIWAGSHKILDSAEKAIKFVDETLSDTNTKYKLIKSNICNDDLPSEIQNIAVANVDVDIYEATLKALQKISPLIVNGGIIICEDPPSTPALYGAMLAMEEFLNSSEGVKFIKVYKGSQYFLIKIK